MKKIGLLYWPTKGNVEEVANEIKKHYKEEEIDILDLSTINADTLDKYENLILGSSTSGADYWEDVTNNNKWHLMFHDMDQKNIDLKKKNIALYGLGDQIKYPHHFVDGMKAVYDYFTKHNANIVGSWPNEGFEFYQSKALIDDKFIGLPIDLDNHNPMPKEDIKKWLDQLNEIFG